MNQGNLKAMTNFRPNIYSIKCNFVVNFVFFWVSGCMKANNMAATTKSKENSSLIKINYLL